MPWDHDEGMKRPKGAHERVNPTHNARQNPPHAAEEIDGTHPETISLDGARTDRECIHGHRAPQIDSL